MFTRARCARVRVRARGGFVSFGLFGLLYVGMMARSLDGSVNGGIDRGVPFHSDGSIKVSKDYAREVEFKLWYGKLKDRLDKCNTYDDHIGFVDRELGKLPDRFGLRRCVLGALRDGLEREFDDG